MSVDGDLVALRAREPEDADFIAVWHSDEETMRWWDRGYPPLPPELLAARLANAAVTFAEPSFTITDKATRAPIGWCGLHHVSATHRHAELGVLIGDPAYRGRGYGSDATRTLCRFAFDRMGLARLTLTVFPGNTGARRVYDSLGFVAEGVQRQAHWKHGAWHDLVHMAVFPETLT